MVGTEPGANLDLELRRGVLAVAVLSQLRAPEYGYSLRQALAARGLPIEEGTLYPLLRRLEAQGLLESEWRVGEGPPRRYYRLSEKGRQTASRLTRAWREMAEVMDALLKDEV